MSNDLFEKRSLEFIENIIKNKRLPKVWELKFKDGQDQRLWFNKISKLDKFKEFVNKVNETLEKFGSKLLSDLEKEEEFLECVSNLNRVPFKSEYYFTDNDDMYMWYINYKKKNKDFETRVHNSLNEYQELDLATIWPDIKQEFIFIIKGLKRIPEHGEKELQNGIDVRVIYDKLETFDPLFVEKLLLHLQTYNKDGLSIEDRKKELLLEVSTLGYIPILQESRFSDKTDMFTWYTRYKNKIANLEEEVTSLIRTNNPNKNVNIYLIPKFRKSGGKFYIICTNVGERLDLSNITSYEEALQLDSSLKNSGGLILKKDEEISSVSFVKGRNK